MARVIILIFICFVSIACNEEVVRNQEGFEYGDNDVIRIMNRKNVELKNKIYDIYWDNKKDKYGTTFIYIAQCEKVIISDLIINQMNNDYTSSYSILIEDCKNVSIKNCEFSGTTGYHLRLEGCKYIEIDGVVVRGREYLNGKTISGGGIWINNGDTSMERGGIWSKIPYELKVLTIKNSSFLDNYSDGKKNLDGILIHSSANGVISNCMFKNWQSGDSAIDASHRRTDESYSDNLLEITNNLFVNSGYAKTNGNSTQTNTIVWAKNTYIDTMIVDYHKGWNVYHINETIYSSKIKNLFKNHGISDGETKFVNCLFVSQQKLKTVFGLGVTTDKNAHKDIISRNNIFLMPDPEYFVVNGFTWEVNIKKFSQWQSENKDDCSVMEKYIPIDFINKVPVLSNSYKLPCESISNLPKRILTDMAESIDFGCIGSSCSAY